jgi:hypothetical protein
MKVVVGGDDLAEDPRVDASGSPRSRHSTDSTPSKPIPRSVATISPNGTCPVPGW